METNIIALSRQTKLTVKMPPCTIVELFDAVAKEMGYENPSEIKYDCTKINVAANIQDGFYEHYTNIIKESAIRENNIYISDHDIKVGITMHLAMSGPKVDTTLKANEVEVFDGFIIESEA